MTNYLGESQFYIGTEDFDELTKNGSIESIKESLEDLENKLYKLELDYEQKIINKFLYIRLSRKQVERFNKNFDLIVSLNKKIADMYRDKGEEVMADKLDEEIENLKNKVNEDIDKRLNDMGINDKKTNK